MYSQLFLTLGHYLKYPADSVGGAVDALKGIKKITGCYHVDNESARIMNERLGRRPVRVTTEYEL